MRHTNKKIQRQAGFAALLSTMVILAIVLVVVTGLSLTTIIEQKITANIGYSARAFYAAESGVEDAVYRLIKNHPYSANSTLAVDTAETAVTITQSASQKTILARGKNNERFRSLEIKLDSGGQGASFYYGVQVGDGGLVMDNNSSVQGSIYSNGSILGSAGATITGDAWVANSALVAEQQSVANNADFTLGQASPMIDGAQSFIPASSGNLIKISLLMKRVGSPIDKTVRLLTDDGNHPSKNLVSSGSYGSLVSVRLSETEYSWADISLYSPAALQAGVKYWIVLDSALNEDNFLVWGQDQANSYAGGMGQYSANWNAASPIWSDANGDLAFKAWFGQANNILDHVSVGANAHANTIKNSVVSGNAYYQTIDNTTVRGTRFPGSADPASETMPIPTATIDLWKTQAEDGGIYSGDYVVDAKDEQILGPQKIIGNLTISNGGELTISGMLYVTGNINIFNNAKIILGDNYGSNSGVIITDGLVNVANDCIFSGNGNDNFILLLSTKSGLAISLANNSDTALFYAPNGLIDVNNNTTLKELTAYQIHLNNGAKVIYETGLASINFSSGVSATWGVAGWDEVP